jgi:serine/threonine protein kinase
MYIAQSLLALEYLHAQNVLHRDIKGANLLVDANGRIKVADFGACKSFFLFLLFFFFLPF